MIQVFKPMVDTERILNELRPILNSGWIGLGPKTKEFETKLSEYIGVKHFVALNSATAGLHLAIKCLNLPPKSKILTTPNTFVSTNHAILYENHIPVFCDIEKTTGNIDTDSIEQALKEDNDIKAILIVHIGGYSCDLDRIGSIARNHGIPIIEDCAHAFGSEYKGRKVGNCDNICVWSFQAVKNLPVGDGGAISTNNEEIYNRLNKLRWLGINKDTVSRSNLTSEKQTYNWDYEVEEVGYKYHLTDIASLMGIIGLETIDEKNEKRRNIAKYYRENIKKDVIFPDYKHGRISSSHFYPIFFEDRDNVYNLLRDSGVFCGMHYKRNDLYAPFKEFKKVGGLVNADWYEKHELTLPIHLDLTEKDLGHIVKIINSR